MWVSISGLERSPLRRKNGWSKRQRYLIFTSSYVRKVYPIVSRKVRNTWAKELWRKGWGRNVRVRVTLRQQLGHEPTERELDAASRDLGNKYQDISAEDIREAYDCGEEVSHFLCTIC